jgi:hypothetical protein
VHLAAEIGFEVTQVDLELLAIFLAQSLDKTCEDVELGPNVLPVVVVEWTEYQHGETVSHSLVDRADKRLHGYSVLLQVDEQSLSSFATPKQGIVKENQQVKRVTVLPEGVPATNVQFNGAQRGDNVGNHVLLILVFHFRLQNLVEHVVLIVLDVLHFDLSVMVHQLVEFLGVRVICIWEKILVLDLSLLVLVNSFFEQFEVLARDEGCLAGEEMFYCFHASFVLEYFV